nr:hypothetical protein [Chenggangzhangella methanolivorans]
MPKAKEAVSGSRDPEVARPRGDHLRIGAEEPEPGGRRRGGREPDGFGGDEREGRARKRDPLCAHDVARSDIRADERHQRRAEAERQRDQQVFEPGARPVARQRAGPRHVPDDRGDHDEDQVGLDGRQRGERADLEDVGEEPPFEALGLQPDEASARQDVPGEIEAPSALKIMIAGRRRARRAPAAACSRRLEAARGE